MSVQLATVLSTPDANTPVWTDWATGIPSGEHRITPQWHLPTRTPNTPHTRRDDTGDAKCGLMLSTVTGFRKNHHRNIESAKPHTRETQT